MIDKYRRQFEISKHLKFILVSIVCSSIITTTHILTHPFPPGLGGLYLQIAESITQQGGRLPVQITGYTTEGIPLAYPPLGFYFIELLTGLGIDRIQVLRVGAPSLMLLLVATMYHFTYTIFDSYQVASIAGIVLGTHTGLIQPLLSGAGFVRTLGTIFALLALASSYNCFVNKEGLHSCLLTALWWGLSVLTHPVLAAVAGIGVFTAWLIWDQSIHGFSLGASIAIGGLTLASPWWATVISRHGFEIFVISAGSHSSFTHSVSDIIGFVRSFWLGGIILDWPRVMALIGGVWLIIRGDWRYVLWLTIPVAMLVPPHPRLWLLVIAPLSAIGLITTADLIGDAISTEYSIITPSFLKQRQDQIVVIGIVALFVIPFIGINAVAASTFPAYIDHDDQEAMTWIKQETSADSDIVAVGAANEWIPYLANRTSVVTPYGTEWVDRSAWDRHISTQNQLIDCLNASCINSTLRTGGFPTNEYYIYLQKEGQFAISPAANRSLAESSSFDLSFNNQDVVIYQHEEV